MQHPTALIAEDEPLLAAALQAELEKAWPELTLLTSVGDGEAAVAHTLKQLPDVLFFDIQMPVMNGLDAAFALADDWPINKPFPALVFVTAFDQFAVQAFEAQAVDYVLKPVRADRLAKTVAKLRTHLAQRATANVDFDATLAQLRALATAHAQAVSQSSLPTSASPPALLTVIAASVGTTIHMVPITEVVWFEAADKYVRVLTAEREYLIRTSLKELLPQLDARQFWQIHRGSVVQVSQIGHVSRDEAGKLWLQLRSRPEKVAVSRLWAHLFKAM